MVTVLQVVCVIALVFFVVSVILGFVFRGRGGK